MGKSPEGKVRSSQNSTKHGVRAKSVVILARETQEDYDEVVSGWNDYWQPADYQEKKLVETLIRNDWMHKRAQRWQLDAEAAAVGEEGLGPADWTAEQRHKMELMQRYNTTAERAFYRAWSALRGLDKDIMRDHRIEVKQEREIKKLEAQLTAQKPTPKSEVALTPAQKLFQGQKSRKKLVSEGEPIVLCRLEAEAGDTAAGRTSRVVGLKPEMSPNRAATSNERITDGHSAGGGGHVERRRGEVFP